MKKILSTVILSIIIFAPLFGRSESEMHGMYGLYPMTRESSGTSWQPDSTPQSGSMVMTDDWTLMFNGFANGIYNHQAGRRGSNNIFSTNMFMTMAQREIGPGTLGLRSMFSLDPLMGRYGYPLLLQSGESGNGVTPLVDWQHPHNFFMELASTYSLPLNEHHNIFGYFGLVGEPALGPPVFMMRWSGIPIPEAPLSHHWLDSTHVTFGVATLGYIWRNIKLEGSVFQGREPNENRWQLGSPRFNSQSIRLSYNPSENWALQVSYGFLKSPEQLEPDSDQRRTTASAIYNLPFNNNNNWQTIFAWGHRDNKPGNSLNAYLLESAVSFKDTHLFFGRAEHLQLDELFESDNVLHGKIFDASKFSVGYIHNFLHWRHMQVGLGGLVSTYILPATLQQSYGRGLLSYMLFGQVRLV
ncbi:MAG: hypothetical protein K0S63_622 [Gammaproteobacteria bacterium]|nr:hypothetical protein [Gammaproteobacteria bacterium]